MAENLSAFLKQNVDVVNETEYVASKRIKVNGEPVAWKIKTLATDETEKMRKKYTKRITDRITRQSEERFDATAFAGNTAVREQINCIFILGEINANTCQFLLPNTNVDNIVVPSGIGTGIVKFTDNEHRTNIMPLLTPTYQIRKEQST